MSACSNCHKDFCQCSRPALEAARARAADWRSFNVERQLKAARICYRPAPTANVVIIGKSGKPDVYLSLVPDKQEYKYRVAGKRWARMNGKEFMKRIATAYADF
jgi:hypothetical protein